MIKLYGTVAEKCDEHIGFDIGEDMLELKFRFENA